MILRRCTLLAALLATGIAPSAAPQAPQADRAGALAHIAAAKKAAGYEVADLFDHTCRGGRAGAAAATPAGRGQ